MQLRSYIIWICMAVLCSAAILPAFADDPPPADTTVTAPGTDASRELTATGSENTPKAEEKTSEDKKDKEKKKEDEDKSNGGGGGWDSNSVIFMVLLGMLLLFIFMSGRNRRKQEAQKRAMLAALKKGDKVISIGGIIGTIVEVRETEIIVKVDENSNTRMRFLRDAIRLGGPAAKEEDPEKK